MEHKKYEINVYGDRENQPKLCLDLDGKSHVIGYMERSHTGFWDCTFNRGFFVNFIPVFKSLAYQREVYDLKYFPIFNLWHKERKKADGIEYLLKIKKTILFSMFLEHLDKSLN